MSETKTTKAKKPSVKAKQEVKKTSPVKSKPATKPVEKKVVKPILKPEVKKQAEAITKEALAAFDAGATLPLNMRIPTPTVTPKSSTVSNIEGRPSLIDLIQKMNK